MNINFKIISLVLLIVIFANFIVISPWATISVKASFLEEHRGSLFTVLKGLVMLWIMNLIYQNTGEEENEDIITSTIKKGLGQSEDISEEDNSTNKEDNPEDVSPEVEIISVDLEDFNLHPNEQQLVSLINEYRINEELSQLEISEELSQIARVKAEDMVENNYFDHQSPRYGSPFEMLAGRKIDYSLASENIIREESVEKGFTELVKREKNKKDILKSSYTKIGVGITEGNSDNLYMVILFLED